MFSVPSSWPDGDYVAYLEINTEGDYNAKFNNSRYPTPMSSDWDSWAISYGYPYRGQPSVVFSVPFTLGRRGDVFDDDADRLRLGRRDRRRIRARCTRWTARSPTIPQGAPGSGADRLRIARDATARLEVEVRPASAARRPRRRTS